MTDVDAVRRLLAGLGSDQPRLRALAADEVTDWPEDLAPPIGAAMSRVLEVVLAIEINHDARESMLNALTDLAMYVPVDVLQRLCCQAGDGAWAEEYVNDLREAHNLAATRSEPEE